MGFGHLSQIQARTLPHLLTDPPSKLSIYL